jgi:hypothetical protein
MPEAPLRLPLGNDAMAVLRNGYKTSAEELEHWAEITKSTDFDGLAVSDTGPSMSWEGRTPSERKTASRPRAKRGIKA